MGNKSKLLEENIVAGQAITLYQDIELQFQGSQLTSLQEFDASKLTESAVTVSEDSKTKAKMVTKDGKRKLLVTVEGIHTGMTKNLTFYPGNALEESLPSWTSPHNKPVIKNHNIHSEPLGRIVSSSYGESILTDKYTVKLQLEITDQDAIEKVLDGRYLTLSVGGSANKVNCSVCAKDLVQEGFCGHYRGKKYEGKTAHWIIGNYTGDEISFVNMPADTFSQVIAKELAGEEGNTKMGEGVNGTEGTEGVNTNEGTQPEGTQSQTEGTQTQSEPAAEPDTVPDIDGILNNSTDGEPDNTTSDDTTPPVNTTEGTGDGNDDPAQNDPKDPQDPPATQTTESEMQAKLDAAEAKIAKLETDLATAEADNLTLSADLSEAETKSKDFEAKLEEANKNLKSAEEEAESFKKQNLSLARFSKTTLAERVADLRILHGKNKLEEHEALVQEWSGSSVKVMQTTIADLMSNKTRTIPTVPSPGLAVGDKNNADGIVDEDGNPVVNTQTTEKKKPVTMADLEESMIGYMSLTK